MEKQQVGSSPIDFITSNGLGKYRVSGDQVELGCPNKKCPNAGQNQFYINKNTGAYFCHRCNWKGSNLKSLSFKLGLISLQPVKETEGIYYSPLDIEAMQDALFEHTDAFDYLTAQRGFSQETIEQFKLGYKEYDNYPVITIPFFDKSDMCVGMKYYFYTKPDGVSKMRFEKDSKVIAYNLNNITLTTDLTITEGEFDAMSAWQYGYQNVVSIPNGANSTGEWTESLEGARRYLIATDMDKAGQDCAKRLAEVFGASKCYRVNLGFKDLNEYLQAGIEKIEVDKAFKESKPMFKAPITDVTNYVQRALDQLNQPQVSRGWSTGWSSVDQYLGGIRQGEVTVTSGITGHGKTTFAMAMISNLVAQKIPCLIISPEMPEQDLLLTIAKNHFKKNITSKESKEFQEFAESLKGLVFIANVYNEWTNKKQDRTIDHVFDLIDHSVRHNGVKFVLLDHLRFFIMPKEQESERFCIDQFMQKCVKTAISSMCHIWLVVQPKNLPAAQKKITLMDLKGSSNIGQDAHNVVLVHRHEDAKKEKLVEISVVKNRKLGLCGTAPLTFDLKSMANYYES